MKIGIPLSRHAYTPEAYAYEKYLSDLGWEVQLDYMLDPDNDINIQFMGVAPFWKKKEGKALIVHEYQSLSVPPYAFFKDFYKKSINKKPSARIFLNNIVYSKFNFKDEIPYIFRDMGVDEIFFQPPNNIKLYDIVYCGSINRVGLLDCITQLARMGYKIIIVGYATEVDKNKFSSFNNVVFYGPATRLEIADIYKNCTYGLNYTPDIFPFNVQTSTKTIEYLASGLQLISNKYFWVENFCLEMSYKPLWLESFLNGDEMEVHTSLNMDKYKWDNILSESLLDDFFCDLLLG